jgi:hypothetical protein
MRESVAGLQFDLLSNPACRSCSRVEMLRLRRSSASLCSGSALHDTTRSERPVS